jgi:hypothetical protein
MLPEKQWDRYNSILKPDPTPIATVASQFSSLTPYFPLDGVY